MLKKTIITLILGIFLLSACTTVPEPEIERFDVEIGDSQFKGDENAPVKMIAFEDFQCGYCEAFNLNILPLLEEEYISTGKVQFVYKDFPIRDKHPEAQKAAEATRCAGLQGMFWEYHDQLYGNKAMFNIDQYKMWATDMGLDATFYTCLDNGDMAELVNADYDYGLEFGVDRTPTIFVNGIPLRGLMEYEVYKRVIDEELARS